LIIADTITLPSDVGDVKGNYGGPTYQMVDDYSYALGDVYLCGLSLHGSMTGSCSDRVHGVAPTWCAIENSFATLGKHL